MAGRRKPLGRKYLDSTFAETLVGRLREEVRHRSTRQRGPQLLWPVAAFHFPPYTRQIRVDHHRDTLFE